ncbi:MULTISPECIES: rhomboid family intramembrane serine protease [Psychrobacter]|jgi:membrane associated rhomboid family serine protease|uniref:rhomboid family intramembrane serine protease n=1 Tax=Psychrobacter TaxID=497 RepID=UPI000354DD3E|nr:MULTISPECIES: rhomboid family intramembrane serine protease [unclassified Psychrobacter]AGP49904.1 protease [Psychrobacter sp. G]MBA2058542.1 rhomboid family intramembrane serine protease [Psychrobacter sp. D2]|tara:strand:+ start:4824 stop:5429 length:606 start_codon:yes stop_codon:yes gene_type:complete
MKWQQLATLVIVRIKQVFGLYAFVLIPMWVMFFLNDTVFFGLWNIFGIVPRTLDIGSMIGVFASWTMHGNFSHLVGNSLTLMQILFLFGLFENNAYRTILKLIIASGIMTWIIASPLTIHIGASGLCFAMLGFMIGGAVFARRWGYLLACIVMGTGYWLTIKQGLIPQQGISFAAHFGGLCAGLLLGANSKHAYTKVNNRY